MKPKLNDRVCLFQSTQKYGFFKNLLGKCGMVRHINTDTLHCIVVFDEYFVEQITEQDILLVSRKFQS